MVKCIFGGVVVSATVESTYIVCQAPAATEIGPKTVEITLNGVDRQASKQEPLIAAQPRACMCMCAHALAPGLACVHAH